MELNSRLKDFKAAVKHLEEHAPELLSDRARSGSIIRKCRIAMDQGWRCPYTGEGPWDAKLLPYLSRDHIIPFSTRNTNALHALVLTRPWVNEAKGKRTAMQFIEDMASDDRFVTPATFIAWAESHGLEKRPNKFGFKPSKRFPHINDAIRCHMRRSLLLTKDFDDKELGFTDGQLTQSSHLMKLALGALKEKKNGRGDRTFKNSNIDPIPGTITGEIRKAWNLTGTLAKGCPAILGEDRNPLPKSDIRDITHLHHALDAATLALAAHYFPLRKYGENHTGRIWQALTKRRRTSEEVQFLHQLGIFDKFQRRDEKRGVIEIDVRLRDLDSSIKDALARSLAQGRVMQHLPSDRSGAKTKLTTWGIKSTQGGRVELGQRGFIDERGKPRLNPNGSRARSENDANPNGIGTDKKWLRAEKLIGPNPKIGSGKLSAIKGALIISDNYGMALDPTPAIIPFHDVPRRIDDLCQKNGGKFVRVLRNGMLIRLSGQGLRNGIWSVYTVQASLKVDLVRPGTVGRPKKGANVWREVAIQGLIKNGLEILPRRYTGYPLTD